MCLGCTEIRLSSFLSGEFFTAIVVNPPERKLAKRTSVIVDLGNTEVLVTYIESNKTSSYLEKYDIY